MRKRAKEAANNSSMCVIRIIDETGTIEYNYGMLDRSKRGKNNKTFKAEIDEDKRQLLFQER